MGVKFKVINISFCDLTGCVNFLIIKHHSGRTEQIGYHEFNKMLITNKYLNSQVPDQQLYKTDL